MMLSVSELSRSFDSEPVFTDFDFIVEQNRVAVFIGPSGCGKSTLFDTLTGVTPAEQGRIRWQGQHVKHLGELAAYMHQKDLLLPWFTLLENSLLPARTAGENQAQASTEARRLFARLGLSGYEEHLPHQVSGGMCQRCALVRTLMFNRELILLDEPLSALDAITRKSLQSLLLLLQSEFGKTLVMITHDVDEALLLADDLYLLSRQPMRVLERFQLHSEKPRSFDDPELLTIKKTILDQLQGDIEHGAY